jgi:hypothetical protein
MPTQIYFSICDHFEPYRNKADRNTARKRIQKWIAEYPKIAEKHLDVDGQPLKYSFFYPAEEYREDDLVEIANLCHAGFGEVEVHLHHDNDTPENLRKTLLDYKRRLYEKHALLSVNKETADISYGFIHGNWALDNSRSDGRWCGVNNEINILAETGCYGDFTMPSAPSDTQTRKVNSIYYAIDDPQRPKSHNTGKDVAIGKKGEGLLMIQGPLGLTWQNRKYGLFPRIENGGLLANNPPTMERIKSWIKAGISVKDAPEQIFIKIYTHGAQENMIKMLFDDGGLEKIFYCFNKITANSEIGLHYLSAREMANVILAIEKGEKETPISMRDFKYIRRSP